MSVLKQDRIDEYLEHLAGQLGDLPPRERRDELMRIRLRIERDLQELDKAGTPPVETPKKPLGPAVAVAVPAGPARPVRPIALSTRNVEWLGVCGGIAEYLEVDPALVRLGAVVLGLLTGPFALLAYLVAYGALSVHTPSSAVPRASGWKAVRDVTSVTVSAVMVFAVVELLAWVILRGHALLMSPVHAIIPRPWNWFIGYGDVLLYWTLLAAVPLAVLGALPLAGQWNSTLAKLAKAVVALFGIAAAFGVACLFVAALMQVLPHIVGVGVGPELRFLR